MYFGAGIQVNSTGSYINTFLFSILNQNELKSKGYNWNSFVAFMCHWNISR